MKKNLLKQEFNYHTHTYRCHHAYGNEEEYIQAAIASGYKQLGFSDHCPVDACYSDRMRMKLADFDSYIETINSLKEKYRDQIELFVGVEAEPYPENQKNIDIFFEKLDYVILGVHGQSCQDQTNFAFFNTDEELDKYACLIEENLPKHNWLYLAHPDYFLRNQTDFNKKCEEITHRICQAAVKNNTILEINLTGLYYPRVEFKQGIFPFGPHPYFWRIASQYPIKCVYGLDAHDPMKLATQYFFDECDEVLKDIKLDIIDHPLLPRKKVEDK